MTTPLTAEPIPATESKTCEVCKQPFLSPVVMLFEHRIVNRVCQPCVERQQSEAERRRLEAAAEAREAAWELLCPVEFRLTTERNGRTVLERLQARQPKLGELLALPEADSVILQGASGVCKTRSMWRLVRARWQKRRKVRVMTAGQFDRQCRDAGGNHDLSDWFEALAECDLFVLDDLGKHPWTEHSEATFFDLIDERCRYRRPFAITTNDRGADLTGKMSERYNRAEPLLRRLREYCTVLVFK